jgi:predicted glutamine amidotransferase
MCRLFGLHAGTPVRATFWLLDAPDSSAAQSHREPDGAGIGVFDRDGQPVVHKQPIAAWQDAQFATDAQELRSAVFVAHVRYASTGGLSVANTHPFTQDGRTLAHNGAFAGLDQVDRRLAGTGANSLVSGDTDSERMFALITAETRSHGGDVEAGIVSALTWMAQSLPIYSLNLLLATADTLWALRYPDTNELHILQRQPPNGANGALDAASPRIHARSADLADQAATIIASEPMDDDPNWRAVQPGELIRVDADQSVYSTFPLPPRPAHQLSLDDLGPNAASSQKPRRAPRSQ